MKAIRTMLTEATEVDNNPAEIYWFSQISGYYLWAMLELYSRNYDQAIIYAGKVMEAKGGYDVLGESVYSKFWGNEACAERIFLCSLPIHIIRISIMIVTKAIT